MRTLATWRRKAWQLFPEARADLRSRNYPAASLFACHLGPAVRAAHGVGDAEALRPLYAFAEWCLTAQPAAAIGDAVRLSFYWHVFDRQANRDAGVPLLSPEVLTRCWPMWERILSEEELVEIQRLIFLSRHHRQRAEA